MKSHCIFCGRVTEIKAIRKVLVGRVKPYNKGVCSVCGHTVHVRLEVKDGVEMDKIRKEIKREKNAGLKGWLRKNQIFLRKKEKIEKKDKKVK